MDGWTSAPLRSCLSRGALSRRGGSRGGPGRDFRGITPAAHRLPAGNLRDGSGSAPWDTRAMPEKIPAQPERGKRSSRSQMRNPHQSVKNHKILAPLENLWVERKFFQRSRMDFFRHGSGVPWLLQRAAPGQFLSQGPSVPWAHRRPGYPLSGCVPAEPDSVSPGQKRLPEEGHWFKCPGTPEPCLENPRGLGDWSPETSPGSRAWWGRLLLPM